ncbi:MAG: DUF4837 family protein [Tannerellaceae bacterium]|jgi:hypothetical protein|nr:DUF4837 family protein [Tannerellaceae bacterium]
MKASSYLMFMYSICSVVLTACSSSPLQTQATGTPYEIVVSVDRAEWEGEMGELIKADLQADIPMLPQPEPAFRVMFAEPGRFGTLLKHVRNVFIVNINPEMYTQIGLSYERDKWAKGQMTLTLNAPDRQSVMDFFGSGGARISSFFSKVEMNRATLLLGLASPTAPMDSLLRRFGVKICLPYEMKATRGRQDFFWVSDDGKRGRSDVIVYTFPYTDVNTFTVEYLMAKRDSVLRLNMPGGRPDSYMKTETLIGPEYEAIRLRGKYCGLMRGLWRMVGDAMGGPFVSIARVDEAKGRVIVAEGFVYAPETKKRNMIRKLEAALYTLRLADELDRPVEEPYKNIGTVKE